MWMVVGVASNQSIAERMQKVLEKEGILVKVRNACVRTKQQGSTFEIMVLESEANSSREVLLENGF